LEQASCGPANVERKNIFTRETKGDEREGEAKQQVERKNIFERETKGDEREGEAKQQLFSTPQ